MFLSSIYSRAAWSSALGFTISMTATPSRVYADTYTKDLIDTDTAQFQIQSTPALVEVCRCQSTC